MPSLGSVRNYEMQVIVISKTGESNIELVEGCKGDEGQRDQRHILSPMKSYIYILEYKESLSPKSEDWITKFGDQ